MFLLMQRSSVAAPRGPRIPVACRFLMIGMAADCTNIKFPFRTAEETVEFFTHEQLKDALQMVFDAECSLREEALRRGIWWDFNAEGDDTFIEGRINV